MFAILIGKLTAFILHIFGKGATTLPGRVALKIKATLIKSLSQGVKIICVTGTNGKTTTCALLEHTLNKNGISYFINKSGANMISGIATAFLVNSTIGGKCKKDYAILECDENSLPKITKYLSADIIAVTNIFRDQLDRYGETSITLAKICEGIKNNPSARVLLNADCPLTYSLSKQIKNPVFTFGISESLSVKSVSDAKYCPICDRELIYKSRTFAQLGNYLCPRCSYSRPKPDFEISEIKTSENGGYSFIISGEIMSTVLGGIYNLYNICCAYSVLSLISVKNTNPLCTFTGAFGRMESFKSGDNTILLLLVKNPVGLSGCIKYVSAIQGAPLIVFALNDNDADGRDVSWIWDSDFTPLRDNSAPVYTLGRRSYDMALRLKYDGINAEILSGEAYKELIEIIVKHSRDTVIFSSYTAMMTLRKSLIDRFGGKEFWE